MDARQLEYFLAIVDHNGFSRAADRLHVAQPSLSQAIQTLERDLGVPLFHRLGRRVVPTEAGEALIEPARQVLRDLETTRATVESIKGARSGRVDIAAMPSQAVEPLTTMITRFTERYPGIVVRVRAVFTVQESIDVVRDGSCELALVGSGEELRPPGVLAQMIEEQRFILAAPPGLAIGDTGRVTWDGLSGRRVVAAPEGSRMRHIVDQIRAHGVDLSIAVEVAHRESILPLVVNGAGVAVLTEAWTRTARRSGAQVLELDPARWIRISLLSRRAPLTPAAAAFRRVALAAAHNTHRRPVRP
ncbi:DNA-binding transcriptional LysR family regulator [Spinactinospora alkalitolerans]|uniref:DNA-binding transcriptional LysR family regulator n=1 Tax=Spinactinospora alkalitolerans TaxID=687207 RepID=A0A852TVB8_9ACTN|nr:LysR family transcriptional regulator [Spinactinospora alkalitolerans]NYE47888.1 DNA-binding transcriptional LysR family regulator [Spinactinospora alkalitolerans]